MEKFTNPKRGDTQAGGMCMSWHNSSATNEQHFLPFLLPIFFILFLAGSVKAQYTFSAAGTIGNLAIINLSSQGGYTAPALVDLNGDGKLDIVTGAQDGKFYYYVNDGTAKSMPATPGTPHWSVPPSNPFPSFMDVGFRSAPAFVDIDGDGDLDMFSGTSGGEFSFFENTGTATSPSFIERFFGDNPMWFEDPSNPGVFLPHMVGAVSSIGFLDADAIPDGDYDVVVSNSQGQFFYFENEGDQFTPYFPVSDPGAPRTQNLRPSPQVLQGSGNSLLNATVCVVDMNCDHIYDIISGTRFGTFQFRALETTASNGYDHRFNTIASLNAPLYSADVSGSTADYSYPAAGDLDGDGDVDFISGRLGGTLVYFQNNTCNTAPTFTFTSGPGCGGTYPPVNLDPVTGTYDILPADIGSPAANPNGCFNAVVDYSLESVDCDDLDALIPITIHARNTTTGVKSALSCVVYVDVNDNTVPVNSTGAICSGTPYYVDLNANGMAVMGTVDPNQVPNNFTDNCDLTFAVVAQPPSVFQFTCANITAPPFTMGGSPYQIVLRATDEGGNSATCTADIVIRDQVAPAFTGTLPTVNLTRCGTTAATYGPVVAPAALDNCVSGTIYGTPVVTGPGMPTYVQDMPVTPASPYTFTFTASGTYTITWTFTDGSNTSSVNQTVVVTTAPLTWDMVGLTCPGPVTYPALPTPADPGLCSAVINLPAPNADDCDGNPANNNLISYSNTHPSNVYNVGTTTVVYSATLGANTINCVVLVTVVDRQAPVVSGWTNAVRTAPTNGTFTNGTTSYVFNTGQSCGIVVNWNPPAATSVTDNCTAIPTLQVQYEYRAPGSGVFVPVTTVAPGSTFSPGFYRVTYNYADAAGNMSSNIYTFTFEVRDNIVPTITCPNPIVTTATPGQCYADVFLPTPSGNFISDNCTLPSNAVTGPFVGTSCPSCTIPQAQTPMGQPNFYRFDKGVNTIHFDIVDANGNMNNCAMTITVNDLQKPVFTCNTADVTLTAAPTFCQADYTWNHPAVTDNCMMTVDSVKITGKTNMAYTMRSLLTGTFAFNEGESIVTYKSVDMSGNTETCSFKVKVTNSIPPSFSNCPALQGAIPTVNTDPGVCYYTLRDTSFSTRLGTFGGGTGCDAGTMTFFNLATNSAQALGSQLAPGTYVLRATLRDYSSQFNNLQSTCQFQVTVRDNQPPFVTAATAPICNSTVTTNMSPGQCTGIPSFLAPAFQDNCGSVSSTATYQNIPTGNSGTFTSTTALLRGINVLTFRATDSNNNQTACIVTVNVVDNQAPVFDNCPQGTQFVDISTPTSCLGTFTRTLTATDNCTSMLTSIPVTIQVDLSASTPSIPSTSTMTFTASDLAGNTKTCAITVQARDVSGPTIPVGQCPSSINLTIGSPSTCTLPHPSGWADPLGVDDCTGPVTLVSGPVAVSQNQSPITVTGTTSNRNAQFPTGVNTVTYTYRDAAVPANTSTCSFTVTVTEAVPPVVTCPSPITVSTENTSCSRTLTTAYMLSLPADQRASAVDLCSPNIQYSTTLPVGGTVVSAGSNLTVTWVATDNSNNSGTCTQSVRVRDLTPPTLVCGAPYTVTVLPNNTCVENNNTLYPVLLNPSFSPALPTPSDNCTLPFLAVTREPGQPGQYCVGTHQMFWRVTDGNGNTATCAQQIIVLANSCTPTTPAFSQGSNCGSTTPFVLANANCPTSVTVTAAQLGINATDNCGNALSVGNQTINVNATGTQTVTFSASVGSNTVTCARTVSVTCNPTGPCTPTAIPTFAGCGGAINVNADANCQATVSFGVTATDNCGTVTVTPNHSTSFGVGSTTVTFTATNTVGSNTCTKVVTVSDVTDPVFASCPPTVTLDAEPGEDFALSINLPQLTASDACTVSVSNDAPNELFDGDVVTWIALDPSGNDASCTQTINVIPTGGAVVCTDQLAVKMALDGLAGDLFGSSVDIDGSRAVVGAPFDDNSRGTNSGAAYILEKDGSGNWVQVAQLFAADGAAGDQFGMSVAIEGNLVIVGANKNASSRGAAYVFTGSGATWTQVKKLVASDGVAFDEFGISVDISATNAIVGAYNDDAPEVNRGSVYIYGKDQGGVNNWGQQARQSANDGATNDNYGFSVSIDGNYAVVGSRYDDDFGTNSGSAYVLFKDQGGANNWGQAAKLTPTDGAAGDYFGSSVAISGTEIIVGSYLDDYLVGSVNVNNAGSAYIFEQSGPSWLQVAKLIPSDATVSDQFGISVSIEGGIAIVGSQFDDDMGTNSGSAYVFADASGWSQVDKLTGSAVTTNDNFGYSVAIGGGSIIVGAYKDDVGSALDQGSVYFYGCPTPQRPASKERTDVTLAGSQVRCFPNPSTDVVNIDITLATEEQVQVFVSDVSGKVISTLFDNKMNGETRLQWEGKQFGNGMYFIRIQSASLRQTVPVVILK